MQTALVGAIHSSKRFSGSTADWNLAVAIETVVETVVAIETIVEVAAIEMVVEVAVEVVLLEYNVHNEHDGCSEVRTWERWA